MRFTLPRDLYHGKGALENLKTLKGKKAIIVVGGGSMKRNGFLQKAEAYLKEAGMEVKLLEGVEPDPSVTTVMNGAKVMLEFEPDWIVAMGGGSPIDAAKAMWIKYEYPDCTFEDMCKVFGIPELRKKAHFCAISSTSGTATEVTAFSIITDYDKGIKYPIADFEITPDVAIVDPDLAETMPQKLTAHTGMDAMTHAIEAYVSTLNCDYTDALALHAIKMIHNDLKKSYDGDMAARDAMHNAQCLAGMAFSNALLGIVHSMAHKTGAAFSGGHIIHGCANAMYLPKVIKYNSKDATAAERYAQIAKFIDLKGDTTEELVDALIAELRSMNDQLDIPQAIKNYGPGGVKADVSIIDEKEFMDKLAETAKMQREKLMAQLDKFFTICQRLCDNEQADVANELPEDTLVICYYGTDPHGNKMFYKNEDMVVPVFADVTVGLVIDSVGLAESEEKLDLWDTLGRYYIDSELMEFYDCDTKNLIFCNLTNSPIYVTIYESSAAMLCMPNTAKIASRKVKEQ